MSDDESAKASAMARAVAKELQGLNANANANASEEKGGEPEKFNCPDCGATVFSRARVCGNCGLELEWSED